MASNTPAVRVITDANLRLTLISGRNTVEIAKAIAALVGEEPVAPSRKSRPRRPHRNQV